jgi:tetratricopeptide (TPR) repeat protein
MKKSFFIILFFLSQIILLYFTAPGSQAAELIAVDPDVDAYHKEINVKRAVDFTIRIKGSGWYLNRYDSNNLSFKLRTVHPEYTDFTIHPAGENPGYLFFSYLDKDMYIRVNIDPRVKSEAVEMLNEKNSDTESNVFKKDEIKKEIYPEGKMPLAEDMYYVTKDKEIVKVPSVNEEIEYKKGVKAFNSDELEKAAEHVLEYMSKCVSCEYKDDARFMAYEIYLKQENEEKAMIFLDELIDFGTQEYKMKAARRKADLNYNAGNLNDALESYKFLLLYDGNNIEVLKNTGDIYYRFKDYENALTNYELGMENGLAVDKVYFRTALMYDGAGKLKDLEKAYRYYRLILEMFPDFEHYPEVKQRVQFMEEHFFNYE